MEQRTFSLVCILVLTAGVAGGKYSGGTGEPNDPYQIGTPNDLNDIGNHVEDFNKCFVMVNDINLADYNATQFNIIGNWGTPFEGSFDGNGHSISNLTFVSAEQMSGIFGCLFGTNPEVTNLGLVEPNISASGRVGAFVGYLHDGTLSGCFAVDGRVAGGVEVGALVGAIAFGSVSDCYSTSEVEGSDHVGGLVGTCYWGGISDSYSTGHVVGPGSMVGGLVGEKNAAVISGCFWDVNSSGQSSSDGGTGKTTAEMRTESTFTDAGWDFVEVWGIGEGQTYPFLQKYLAGDSNHDGVVDWRDFSILASRWLEGI